MKKLNTLPLSINLSGKRVLFVGGGEVAARKIAQWSGRGAEILVVAPVLSTALELNLPNMADVKHFKRYFDVADLESVDLVQICTNNSQVNDAVEAACRAHRIWFCRSDQSHSDFTGMSLIEEGPVQIGIGSSGMAPVAVRMIKQQILNGLDFQQLTQRIHSLDALKQKLKTDVADQKQRTDLLRKASEMTIEEIEGLLDSEALYSRFKG